MITKYSPLAITEGAIADEIGDDIQLPDPTEIVTLVTKALGTLLDGEADNMLRWVEDLLDTISAVLNGTQSFSVASQNMLGDTFWTVFDGLAELALALFDIIEDFMKCSLTIVESAWKIPLISDLWNDFVDQDLSLINLLALPAATALNLYYKNIHDGLPFEDNKDYTTYVTFTDGQLSLEGAVKALQGWLNPQSMEEPAKDGHAKAMAAVPTRSTVPSESESLSQHPLIQLLQGTPVSLHS